MIAAPGKLQNIAQLAAAELAQAASGRLYRWMPLGKTGIPHGILTSPRPVSAGNKDHARQIYQGRFTLAGTQIDTGTNSPFGVDNAPPEWRMALSSFSWLGDLAMADSELARAQARWLITDWINSRPQKRGPDWSVSILSDRLIAWLAHAPFYLTNAGESFHRLLMTSIGCHVRHLQRILPGTRMGLPRLRGVIALNHAIVCTDGLEKHLDGASTLLNHVLDDQLLPDGGHVSRNPVLTADVLADLLPLRTCYVERQIEPPDTLLSAIDRMFPFVRLFLHGDKGLAFFNGSSQAGRRKIASLLAQDTEQAKPLGFAHQSGYGRLEQGATVIIADIGSARSVRGNDTGHAGALSFEMSHGSQRMIVNCGHCATGPAEWRTATSATAAHSTLTLADRSSVRVYRHPVIQWLFGGPLAFGPGAVTADIQPSDAGLLLSAQHDGYVDAFGLTHHREIYLASDGADIRGEDRLSAPTGTTVGAHPFAIRFHLHPSIKATLSKDNLSILLMLPDRTGWKFNARGAQLTLEESVYFSDRDVPHRTEQIVLSAETASSCAVRWSFKVIENASPPDDARRPRFTRLPLRGGRMNGDTMKP